MHPPCTPFEDDLKWIFLLFPAVMLLLVGDHTQSQRVEHVVVPAVMYVCSPLTWRTLVFEGGRVILGASGPFGKIVFLSGVPNSFQSLYKICSSHFKNSSSHFKNVSSHHCIGFCSTSFRGKRASSQSQTASSHHQCTLTSDPLGLNALA